MRLLDRRPHLAFRELQAVERVVGRSHAARHHDLHVVGALAHLLARRLAHLVGTIGDRRLEGQAAAAGAAAVDIRAAPAVGVAARGPDRLAGDEQARADEMTLLDARLDAPITSARVAHRGEAAVEHGAQPCCRARREQGQRHRLHEADVDLAVDDVHVAVDQPRHQRAPAAIDDVLGLAPDRLVAALAHAIVLDQQLIAAAQLAVGGLEQLEVLEVDLGHPVLVGVMRGAASGRCRSDGLDRSAVRTSSHRRRWASGGGRPAFAPCASHPQEPPRTGVSPPRSMQRRPCLRCGDGEVRRSRTLRAGGDDSMQLGLVEARRPS